MTINFNSSPYYDDFDENKNYHKILFKPEKAVQARELTQLQTILQDQIAKFGKFVLAEGSKVSGGKMLVDQDVRVTQLVKYGTTESDIINYNELYAVGTESKFVAKITSVDYDNLLIVSKPLSVKDTHNFLPNEIINLYQTKSLALLFIINSSLVPTYTTRVDVNTTSDLINSCTGEKYDNIFTIPTTTLAVGDLLSDLPNANNLENRYYVIEIIDGTHARVDKPITKTVSAVSVRVTKKASRSALEMSIDDGIFFTNGIFVKNTLQSIVPNNKTQFPSCIIGLKVVESVKDYIDDPTLLDPALGASNYSAPGADRYVIELQLVSKPLTGDSQTDLTTSRFIELMRIEYGNIIKSNSAANLGELEKTLARQLYDHAGDFFVKPFTIKFDGEQLKNDSNTYPLHISEGKAYVKGHEFELQYPLELPVRKSRDYLSTQDYFAQPSYGLYYQCKDLKIGKNILTTANVELYNSNTIFATPNKIGTALIKNIECYDNTNKYFNIYLSDILLNNGVATTDVKGIAANTGSGVSFKANTISNLVIGNDKLIFSTPHQNIKSVSGVNFTYNSVIDLTFAYDGSNYKAVYDLPYSDVFQGGTGTLSAATVDKYYLLSAQATNGSYAAMDNISSANTTVTLSTDNATYNRITIIINSPLTYSSTAKLFYTAKKTNATVRQKTLTVANTPITFTSVNTPISLGVSDVYKVSGLIPLVNVNGVDDITKWKGVWNSGTTYAKAEVITFNGYYYVSKKSSNLANNPSTDTSNWKLIDTTFVTDNYTVNSGQKVGHYDHGSITPKVGSAIAIKTYLVIVQYFTHGTGDVLTRASYPISYVDIPDFIDGTNTIKIKDAIDFRPRREDNLGVGSFNAHKIPTNFTSIDLDYEYYLQRIDRLYLSENNKIKIQYGNPTYTNPIIPEIPRRSMGIATLFYKPYGFSKDDIKIIYDDHKRYTMDDIGTIEKRVNRLEEYATLTIAESNALNNTNDDALLSQRLKSGILVDSFSSTIISMDQNNLCEIDVEEKYCTARRIPDNQYKFSLKSTNGFVKGDKIYCELDNPAGVEILNNKEVTSTISINPFDSTKFKGNLKLIPNELHQRIDLKRGAYPNIIVNLGNLATTKGALDLKNSKATLDYPGTSKDTKDTINNIPNKQSATVSEFIGQAYKKALNDGKNDSSNKAGYKYSTKISVEDTSGIMSKIPEGTTVKLQATGLAPLTKMYVFINKKWNVSGFCIQQGFTNQIQGIKIENSGSGYTTTPTVSITGANTKIASAYVSGITGGKIDEILFTNYGEGYSSKSAGVTISGGGGSGATASLRFLPHYGGDLMTDSRGNINIIFNFPPKDKLAFSEGDLNFTICNHPVNPDYSISSAESTFKSTISEYDSYEITGFSDKPVTSKPLGTKDPKVKNPPKTTPKGDTYIYEANTAFPQWTLATTWGFTSGSSDLTNFTLDQAVARLDTGNERNIPLHTYKAASIDIYQNSVIDEMVVNEYEGLAPSGLSSRNLGSQVDLTAQIQRRNDFITVNKSGDKWDASTLRVYGEIILPPAFFTTCPSNVIGRLYKFQAKFDPSLIIGYENMCTQWWLEQTSGSDTWDPYGITESSKNEVMDLHPNNFYSRSAVGTNLAHGTWFLDANTINTWVASNAGRKVGLDFFIDMSFTTKAYPYLIKLNQITANTETGATISTVYDFQFWNGTGISKWPANAVEVANQYILTTYNTFLWEKG